MSPLVLHAITAGPRLDHPVSLASGPGLRTVHTGTVDLGTPTVEGPARRAGQLTMFVPDARELPADAIQRGAVAIALVVPHAIHPLTDHEVRVNVLGAMARFAPAGAGLRVALDLSVEALGVTMRNTLRLAYQVELIAP